MSQEDRWLKKYSRAIPVWFQGVWDTVGTLGMPIPVMPHVSRDDFNFLETDLHINDARAYHALAIDEHRPPFTPTLWMKTTPTSGETPPPREFVDVEQRWFVGAHANIGGGYENDLLAQTPLKWLMEKAIEHGLEFKDTVELDDGATACPIRDSLAEMAHGIYEILTLGKHYYRPIGVDPVDTDKGRVNTINESIDATVFARWRADSTYRPQNLVEWSQRRQVDPATLCSSVSATDPSRTISE